MTYRRTQKLRRAVSFSFVLSAASVLALGLASQANACVYVMDSFIYSDGPLDGQGGGLNGPTTSWTTTWSTTDPINVAGGKSTVGNTSSTTYTATREFDLTGATNVGDSIYFMAELTEVTDNHEDFLLSVDFFNTSNNSVSFGLQGFQATGTQAFGTINSSTSYSTGTYDADHFYWVYGRLDFNDLGDETLKVWVNPTYSDVTNGTNAAATTTGELGAGPTSLYKVALTAVTSDTTAGLAKTWDDLAIARDVLGIASPRLDVGVAGNVEPGYDEWAVSAGTSASTTITLDATTYGLPGGDAQLTIEPLESAESLVAVTGLDPDDTGLAVDLRSDGVEAAGGLLLTFSDWSSERYLKTYHHQSQVDSALDIFVSSDGVAWEARGSVMPTSGDAAAAEAYTYLPQTDSTFYVKFVPQSSTDIAGINGLVIVPEPGTLALLGVAVLGLLVGLARRRRS